MILAAFLLLICKLCLAIRVPVIWDASASEVKQEIKQDEQFSVDTFKPQNVKPLNVNQLVSEKPIPLEYFQYTAKKPQFAADIANFHGVQSPEEHYKAYPIKPHTGKNKPQLGKHHLLDKENVVHQPLREFASINEGGIKHAVPVSSNYEVFHPYAAETPALQEIYKDPVLTKIRSDLENSKNRLQAYEKEAGEPSIHKDEYLESPKKTEYRLVPQKNIPAPYEIHRPQRRPVYYSAFPRNPQREQQLNQKLRHPWNQYSAKIRPVHYRPIKNHIHQLRQNHAIKYDDARNEYPQVQVSENYSSDPKDGYDIYERGKEQFAKLRNNVDESINKAVTENRPITYENIEMQNNNDENEEEEDEEFVPIKNYAQVRKSETYKHLPKSAALEEAENYEEIRNAPRLREAVKSTKAQTVYSEEGYEDTAYDHAGEQKHASENEGHGGYLKEYQISEGKYKTPSQKAKYEDGGGSAYRDQLVHAEKWKDDKKDNSKESDEEDYSENEHEHSIEADKFEGQNLEDENHRNKREDDVTTESISETANSTTSNDTTSAHEIDKRQTNFKIPEIDINSTFLSEDEILKLAKIQIEPKKGDITQKYPYYFKNLKDISKHSPLRYAENLTHIPKKSSGGTEFYDSRSNIECPEVDDVPDPIPQKLKGDGHPDDTNNTENPSNSENENKTAQKAPRLKGLGDKIDCFKAKYFGENPLDSPFFNEEIILNPEPVTLPNSPLFKLKPMNKNYNIMETNLENTSSFVESTIKLNEPNIYNVLEKLRKGQYNLQDPLLKTTDDLQSSMQQITNLSNKQSDLKQQTNFYSDILDNINNKVALKANIIDRLTNLSNVLELPQKDNITYKSYQNIEDITHSPTMVRKKRSSSFVYEPYKIIRDSQVQDSKKTTTTSNISPLIRQLQSSRIVDRQSKRVKESDKYENPVKRNVNNRVYKDIGKTERGSKNDKSTDDPTIVDTSTDGRRGEPRYEIRHPNHKISYTPVENKKTISVDDYKAQTNADTSTKTRGSSSFQRQSMPKMTTERKKPNKDVQHVAASSNSVHSTISTTEKPAEQAKIAEIRNDDEIEEDYEEYDEDEEEEVISTTTTTPKPSFRRRMKITSTTEKITTITEKPKLQLVTRFRNYDPDKKNIIETTKTNVANPKNYNDKSEESAPKYREKKKKSTKRTLVTDTKRYGDDDHDMQKEEVDALIGVTHDMSDYMPLYEKEEQAKLQKPPSDKNESDEIDDDEEDEDDDSDEKENGDEEYDDDDDDSDEDDDDDDDDEKNDSSEPKLQITTPEPTKRTLPVTTDATVPTFASRTVKPEVKPIVSRKKIEIHKELPVNKSAPHVTEFKQDIKEVEIVKEIPTTPKKKSQKNVEVLELYKDDNLAKDINKLGGVEVFKENLDLKNGPRHGGNYRSLEEASPKPGPGRQARKKVTKDDTEASQTEFTKHIELDDDLSSVNQMHGGNLRSQNNAQKTRGSSRGRNSKLTDLRNPPVTSIHGGNLKHRRGNIDAQKSQKLIEFDDDNEHTEDEQSSDHDSFSNSGNSGHLHGGNYRSEKLIATEKPKVIVPSRNLGQSARKTSAAILSSFVQAAPILTTTPVYILDPSKRMYYYVDA